MTDPRINTKVLLLATGLNGTQSVFNLKKMVHLQFEKLSLINVKYALKTEKITSSFAIGIIFVETKFLSTQIMT